VAQEQRDLQYYSGIIDEIRRKVSVDDVISYRPLECRYTDEDPIFSRLAFFMSSILLSIYDQTPDVLRENSLNVLGIEPVKFDLNNPLHIWIVFHYRKVLMNVCSVCPLRGDCPWLSALKLLNAPFKRQ